MLVISLSACATPAQPEKSQGLTKSSIESISKQLASEGRSDQARILKDGSVSAAEYDAAFKDFDSCIEARGYSLSAPVVSPLTGTNYEFVFDSQGRDEAKASAAYNDCSDQHWAQVSAVYMDTARQKIDPPFAQAIESCLEGRGFKIDSKAITFSQIAGKDPIKDKKRRSAAGACAQSTFQSLYPTIPSLTLNY